MRILVVGAGPSGLCMLKELRQIAGAVVKCVDQQNGLGGLWYHAHQRNYQASPMYEGLETNVPKEILSYPDFKISPNLPEFLSAEQYYQYFRRYSKHFDLCDRVKYNYSVDSIRPENPENRRSKFIVNETDAYDVVVNCNGTFFKPKQPPSLRFLEPYFDGRIYHAFDYATADEFRGENVLVFGTGLSGDDINFLLNKTARRVYFVYNREKLKFTYDLPRTEQHGGVECIRGNTVYFSDGQMADIDSIIYATGYDMNNFGYLSPPLQPQITSANFLPLYKHLIHPNYDNLAFPALHSRFILPQIYAQSKWLKWYLTVGKRKQPAEIENDIRATHEIFGGKKDRDIFYWDQFKFEFALYCDMLREAGQEPLSPALLDVAKQFIINFSTNRMHVRRLRYQTRDGKALVSRNQDFDMAKLRK